MGSQTFDANILIDALQGRAAAHEELRKARSEGTKLWISRMVWIEVMSKGSALVAADTEYFLNGFAVDEIDAEVAARAAELRRMRRRLRAPDAIILATAQLRGRTLVTRNVKDFPAEMPGILIPYTL